MPLLNAELLPTASENLSAGLNVAVKGLTTPAIAPESRQVVIVATAVCIVLLLGLVNYTRSLLTLPHEKRSNKTRPTDDYSEVTDGESQPLLQAACAFNYVQDQYCAMRAGRIKGQLLPTLDGVVDRVDRRLNERLSADDEEEGVASSSSSAVVVVRKMDVALRDDGGKAMDGRRELVQHACSVPVGVCAI